MEFKMSPNWKYHCHVTLGKQLTYNSFPVSASSDEYAVICSLLDSVHVTSVEQVVNPTLWDKFLQRRKELLKCKSNDAKALSAIGLNEMEVREALAYTQNFKPHVEVSHVPFDHNMALLFHCTGSKENIENILSEGLDERLGNPGLIGKGIYFADDPKKSMNYDRCGVIFIFGVLLGDCLSMDENETNYDLVREPKKEDDQKRHFNDLFFDSIAGKPDGKHNEFVIYNRYQCVPLYKVNYGKSSASNGNGNHDGQKFDSDEYVKARKDFPEICWKKNSQYKHPMPSISRLGRQAWPFSSDRIFEKMGVSDS